MPAGTSRTCFEPEYPKLKCKYDKNTGRLLEQKVIHDIREEVPYMSGGWFTRPMSELVQPELVPVGQGENNHA